MCMSIHLVTQVPHHNPSTWDMNAGICISPSYPYPRAPLFPKPKIQTLEKIYTNHHIPIPTLISLYPHTTFMVRRLILHGDMHRLIYRAMCKLSIPIPYNGNRYKPTGFAIPNPNP